MRITRQQREAVKRIYDRAPIYLYPIGSGRFELRVTDSPNPGFRRATYREFRKSVVSGFDCAMVQWCNMWLGIEQDGYVHS